MPRKSISPEKRKTEAIFYDLCNILKNIDIIMVQIRMKAVHMIQRIWVDNASLEFRKG